MKVEIFVQYTRERHSNMVKVSQLAPNSDQPLKDQLVEEFRKDWGYFGFKETSPDPVNFQWELGRVRNFWELERDTPPHYNLYEILSRICTDDLDTFSITELALLEDEHMVPREFIIACVKQRVAASTPKLNLIGLGDDEHDDDGDTVVSTSPVLPPCKVQPYVVSSPHVLEANIDPLEPASLLTFETPLKRKRDEISEPPIPESNAVDGDASVSKRCRIAGDLCADVCHVAQYSITGDHPPDVTFADIANLSRSPAEGINAGKRLVDAAVPVQADVARILEGIQARMGTAEDIQRLQRELDESKAETRAARKDASKVEYDFKQQIKRDREISHKCFQDSKDGFKKQLAKERCRMEELLKEKDQLQIYFDNERDSWIAEADELRARLNAADAAANKAKLERQSAINDSETQIQRHKNANDQLQRELDEARATSRNHLKSRTALREAREACKAANQRAADAERALKTAESRLNHELDTVTRLRAERNGCPQAKKEPGVDATMYHDIRRKNAELLKRLEDCEDERDEYKRLVKQKIDLVRRTGKELKEESARADSLQKELDRETEEVQKLRRKHNPKLAARDGWQTRALAAEKDRDQLQEDLNRSVAATKEEKYRLASRIRDLEVQLKSAAMPEHDGAFANIANQQNLHSENVQAMPSKVKSKRQSDKDKRTIERQAVRIRETERQCRELEQNVADLELQLDASQGECDSLKQVRESDEHTISVERAARAQVELELEKANIAKQKWEDTFRALSNTSSLIVPALVEALAEVGTLTAKAVE